MHRSPAYHLYQNLHQFRAIEYVPPGPELGVKSGVTTYILAAEIYRREGIRAGLFSTGRGGPDTWRAVGLALDG